MLTLNQYNETNKKRTSVNNMTFNGGSAVLTKIKPVAADSLTMSSNAKFNAEAKKWLKSAFSEKDGLPSLFYEKCLNSDNNISETALNFLKDEVENKKTLLSRLFKRKGHFAYQNFGDKFLAIMLEAVKNNEENHTDENIGFLRTVLDNYQSENPGDYLDIVVKCKDKNGNVNAKIPNLFNGLSSQIYQYGYKFITIMLDAVKNNE